HRLPARLLDGAAEVGEGVDTAAARVDYLGVVVLPAGLVLLRAPMVVDTEQHRAGLGRRRPQVERRLAAVAAHLEQRPHRGGLEAGLVQRQPLAIGHEAAGGASGPQLVGCHPFGDTPAASRLVISPSTLAAAWSTGTAR